MNQIQINDLTLIRTGHFDFAGQRKNTWLIENIWVAAGTGIMAGEPKTGKTWLAIDMAVSVAAGVPFLDKFPAQQGSVIIYSPEGPKIELEKRIAQVCKRKNLSQGEIPLYVANKKKLFLNDNGDQKTITEAINKLNPALIVFDPLIECFLGDENSSSEIKEVTTFLTGLAGEYSVAILVTHHKSKNNGRKSDGAGMRGSSALYGFGDSYLFLKEHKNYTELKPVQRHAKAISAFPISLTEQDGNYCFVVTAGFKEEKEDLPERILKLLKKSKNPMKVHGMRKTLKGDYTKYNGALKYLKDNDLIKKEDTGWISI